MADTEWVGNDDMRNPRVRQRRMKGGNEGSIRVTLTYDCFKSRLKYVLNDNARRGRQRRRTEGGQ